MTSDPIPQIKPSKLNLRLRTLIPVYRDDVLRSDVPTKNTIAMSLIEIDSIDYMFDGDLKFSGLSNLRIVFVSY